MIICIYGESGVGKDTFADMLLEAFKEKCPFEVKKIKSYTTRKPRYEGEDTHTFISKEEWDKLTGIVAQTKVGDDYYGATAGQFDAVINIYVVDEKGIEDVLIAKKNEEFCIDHGIFVIKMTRPIEMRNIDKERLDRELYVVNETFLTENTHLVIENTVSLQTLYEVAQTLPATIRSFKFIE